MKPKAQALFETTAEVLNGLVKAFNDFERKNEPAWKNPGSNSEIVMKATYTCVERKDWSND